MSEDLPAGEDMAAASENGRDNKIWIIVAVVLIVLCCCCVLIAGGAWWLWNNGDELFNLAARITQALL